jgi:hypothetical protein
MDQTLQLPVNYMNRPWMIKGIFYLKLSIVEEEAAELLVSKINNYFIST